MNYSITSGPQETTFTLDVDLALMRQILKEVEKLEAHYGRERDGVRIEYCTDHEDPSESFRRVVIGVHKHGAFEYPINEYGLIDPQEIC